MTMRIKFNASVFNPAKTTVASVLKTFEDTLGKLEAISEAKARESEQKQAQAANLLKEAGQATVESAHALRVHAKIKELID